MKQPEGGGDHRESGECNENPADEVFADRKFDAGFGLVAAGRGSSECSASFDSGTDANAFARDGE